MDSSLNQRVLEEDVRSEVCDFKLSCSFVMQEDNDPENKSIRQALNDSNGTQLKFWSGLV